MGILVGDGLCLGGVTDESCNRCGGELACNRSKYIASDIASRASSGLEYQYSGSFQYAMVGTCRKTFIMGWLSDGLDKGW